MKHLIYIITIFLGTGIWLTSCRSIKYVPVTSVKHDSIYINQIKYDSIYNHDSVYYAKTGDTIYLYKYKSTYRDKIVRDTVKCTKTDSIPYPVEVKKYIKVEKSLSWWQTLLIWTGAIAWIVTIIDLVLETNKKTGWLNLLWKLIKKVL